MKTTIKIGFSVLLILVLSQAEAIADTSSVLPKKGDNDRVTSSQSDTTLFYASPPSHNYYMVAQSLETPLGGILGVMLGTVTGAGVSFVLLTMFYSNELLSALFGTFIGKEVFPVLTATGAIAGYNIGCSFATNAIGKEYQKGGKKYASLLGCLAGTVVSAGLYSINKNVGIYSLPFLIPAGSIIGYQLSCPKINTLGKTNRTFLFSPIAYFPPMVNEDSWKNGIFGILFCGTF